MAAEPEKGQADEPGSQRRLFAFKPPKVDEARVRIRGSITVPIDQALQHGDLVEVTVHGKVTNITWDEHDSGLMVLMYVAKPEGETQIRKLQNPQLSLADPAKDED